MTSTNINKAFNIVDGIDSILTRYIIDSIIFSEELIEDVQLVYKNDGENQKTMKAMEEILKERIKDFLEEISQNEEIKEISLSTEITEIGENFEKIISLRVQVIIKELHEKLLSFLLEKPFSQSVSEESITIFKESIKELKEILVNYLENLVIYEMKDDEVPRKNSLLYTLLQQSCQS